MILGVGSILDAPTAALYVAYGANFVVGPNTNPEVARFCNRRKISYVAGLRERHRDRRGGRAGVEIVKVFPGDCVGGPASSRRSSALARGRASCRPGRAGDPESLTAWFKAGVAAVGIGGDLIKKEYLESGNFDAMAARTTEILALIREVRS